MVTLTRNFPKESYNLWLTEHNAEDKTEIGRVARVMYKFTRKHHTIVEKQIQYYPHPPTPHPPPPPS